MTENESNGKLPSKQSTGNDGSNSVDSIGKEEVSLAFHNIHYEIAKFNICRIKIGPKEILKNVSGIMYPGLNAIMGPTGSGKTTLLDILAARKDRRYVKGTILMNDKPRSKHFKSITGYVVQDDCLMGTLSVRENVYFSANLRLPSYVSYKERRYRVQEVIEKLGITNVADTLIGTEFTRGVSGGERKRTHIAMELVISPSILFLDEPTTGLDAYTAVQLITLLKQVSDEGKIIIMAIHQPRYAIYKLFDSITLLSQGRTVYQGATSEAIDYFSNKGNICNKCPSHECPERENPADFFLDLIAEKQNDSSENLPERFEEYQTFQQNFQTKLKTTIKDKITSTFTATKYATNTFWQICTIGKRTITNMIRSPIELWLQMAISTFLSLIIGLIYFQLKLTPAGLQNRAGAIFLMVAVQVFSSQSAIMAFMKGKVLFIHENANGYYRTSAYFVTNIMIDLFPKRIAPILIGGTIMYFMTGFQREVAKYWIYILTTSITTIAASSFPLLFGAMVNSFAVASLLTILTYVLMMIFGGLLVNITTLPSGLQWIQYLSIFRLGILTLSVNEIKGLIFCKAQFRSLGNGTCINEIFSVGTFNISTVVTGDSYLSDQGIPHENPFDLWAGVVGLFVYAVVLQILIYIVLRVIKKEK